MQDFGYTRSSLFRFRGEGELTPERSARRGSIAAALVGTVAVASIASALLSLLLTH